MATFQTIWVTGAGGLIGSHLVRTARAHAGQARVVGLTRPELDLNDFDAVDRAFKQQDPAVVIHCAALSRSPDCQANPSWAKKLNVEVTGHLAGLCQDRAFVFFSSDLVFDGQRGNYDEQATPNPLSVYAETKLEAERLVLSNPSHSVIRTSLNGGASPTRDRGFDEQMCRAWAGGQTLKLFTDEFRSPIYAEVTARATWELALRGASGVYHVAGAERLSRWQLGELIAARCSHLHPKIVAGSLKDYQGARRPPDTSLNCTKAQQRLSFRLPGITEWLEANPGPQL